MRILLAPFSGGGLGKADKSEEAPAEIASVLESHYELGMGSAEMIHVDKNNISQTMDNIKSRAASFSREGFLLLGGDHSISYAAFKGFSQDGSALIVLDAHPDMMDVFSPPTHEDWLSTLISEGGVDEDKVFLIGTRAFHKNERIFLNEHKIRHYPMNKLRSLGLPSVADAVMGSVRSLPAVYLSIDIDVADPAFAPGTGYLEPGGLSSGEIIYLLERLLFLGNIRAMDIVEVNPEKDVRGITVELASKLAHIFLEKRGNTSNL